MAEQAIPQMSSDWIRRSLEEISGFATEEVLAAFQDAVGDIELWELAKVDSGAFLRSRNIPVPETLEVVFEDAPTLAELKAARRCLRVCRAEPPSDPEAPPIVWCYEMCLAGKEG